MLRVPATRALRQCGKRRSLEPYRIGRGSFQPSLSLSAIVRSEVRCLSSCRSNRNDDDDALFHLVSSSLRNNNGNNDSSLLRTMNNNGGVLSSLDVLFGPSLSTALRFGRHRSFSTNVRKSAPSSTSLYDDDVDEGSKSAKGAAKDDETKDKDAAQKKEVTMTTRKKDDGKATKTATNQITTSPMDKSMVQKSNEMLHSALQTTISFLVKIPGVLCFYLTHPTEFRTKLTELKQHAVKEAKHLWMGCKLLAADVRTARHILGRTLRGSTLSRRERKQLLRTVTDVFRLVPMSIFFLVPFMEFALPLALKLFPNMLPSTFQDSLKEEEKMKRELQTRISMAGFFQE